MKEWMLRRANTTSSDDERWHWNTDDADWWWDVGCGRVGRIATTSAVPLPTGHGDGRLGRPATASVTAMTCATTCQGACTLDHSWTVVLSSIQFKTRLLQRFTPSHYAVTVFRRTFSPVLEQHWPKITGGSAAEMFEILPRDWNLKPIFTPKWASVDMNWGFNPQPPDNSNPDSVQGRF